MDLNLLKNDEKAVFQLRSLYNKYGYSQYKMSKFEEYDLYVRNKDFLVSDNVITFTDTNGKLMALKPDVTLSIIKNTEDLPGTVHKVYYNENVYRISGGTQSFKEIMQAGLECIGDIDDYCICEVITLAAESLKNISDEFVLDISHLGILSAVIDSLGVSSASAKKLTEAVGEKNAHAIGAICEAEGKNPETLKKLVSTYGSLDKVSQTENLTHVLCGSIRDSVAVYIEVLARSETDEVQSAGYDAVECHADSRRGHEQERDVERPQYDSEGL